MAKLSDLIAQATRDPYPLELADGTTVSIPQPTIPQWTVACEQTGGLTAFLAALGVSDADVARVQLELAGAVYGAESQLIIALRNYFRLGN